MENRTLTLLGLRDGASCEEVYQAVMSLIDRLEHAEKSLLSIEADEAIELNKNLIANPKEFKKLYIAHGGEVALAFLNAMRPAADAKPAPARKEPPPPLPERKEPSPPPPINRNVQNGLLSQEDIELLAL